MEEFLKGFIYTFIFFPVHENKYNVNKMCL